MLKLFSKTPEDLKIIRGPFKGARMYLNPENSRRKIFGFYENSLNAWLSKVPRKKDFAFDVGSNTGYHLYGLAYLLSHGNTRKTHIIGFEPEASTLPEITTPLSWPEYSNCEIEIIEKFAGIEDSDSTATLDGVFAKRSSLSGKSGLIKIDVEGAEVEVLQGAQYLLNDTSHDWLIEIHGNTLIPEVCRFFVERSRSFLIKDLEVLPLLGKERRTVDCYWLLTIDGEHGGTVSTEMPHG